MLSSDLIDAIMAGCYFGVYALYHVYIIHKSRVKPELTVMGVARAARTNWILLNIRRNDPTMVFQALRNLLSTSSTLSSTAISVAFGMFAFISGFAITGGAASGASGGNSIAISFTGWKLALVMAGLFATFLFFAQSMRMWSHAAFLIETKSTMLTAKHKIKENEAKGIVEHGNTPKDWFPTEVEMMDDLTPLQIADLMNSGSLHYTLGNRSFYFSFPLLLFFFNQWIFLAGAVVTLLAVILMDMSWVAGVLETESDDTEAEEAVQRRNRRLSVAVDAAVVAAVTGERPVVPAAASAVGQTPVEAATPVTTPISISLAVPGTANGQAAVPEEPAEVIPMESFDSKKKEATIDIVD